MHVLSSRPACFSARMIRLVAQQVGDVPGEVLRAPVHVEARVLVRALAADRDPAVEARARGIVSTPGPAAGEGGLVASGPEERRERGEGGRARSAVPAPR